MLKPDYLKAGDRVRVVSPAGFVAEEKVLPAVRLLRDEGFEVIWEIMFLPVIFGLPAQMSNAG
jgi:muramoyltetrapeptide carboxypeptidase LdcA involved in peptidoglycan recycling